MTTRHLHIMGVDTGGTSAWYLLTVPRLSIFGDEAPDILERDYGTFTGPEPAQAIAIARLVREIQSLDYKTGVAVMSEDWDIDPNFRSTDPETLSPVRINAMLSLLLVQKRMGDATLCLQSRTIAKQTATDERMKRWGLYVANPHITDAGRQAVVGLRRARSSPDFARALWPS